MCPQTYKDSSRNMMRRGGSNATLTRGQPHHCGLAPSMSAMIAAAPRLEGLTIVLACFDEAENIVAAVAQATAAATACSARHEIVVVDDGSRDDTARAVARIVEADPRVRLIVHETNRGYGAAVRSGLQAARMPWILLTDADLQFDLGDLADFVPCTAASDLIVGWRVLRQDPLRRRINGAAWNWLVRRLFHVPIRDVDCAFKLVRADLARSVALTADGAMISTELVVRVLAAGGRLEELGIRHRPRAVGTQSGARPRVVLAALRELRVLSGSLRAAAPTPG
jgi:glycosyltransferase involved in cell wall biosynthesis